MADFYGRGGIFFVDDFVRFFDGFYVGASGHNDGESRFFFGIAWKKKAGGSFFGGFFYTGDYVIF